MYTKVFGLSDLKITSLGIGTWAMGGGGWAFAAGPQDDNASAQAIHSALDFGINWIDTAPLYGLGHAEEVVGRALRQSSSRPYIFTKCGYIWDQSGRVSQSLRADSVRREVECSLRRLGVDALDLCQIHQPSPLEEIEEGWQTLALLREEGKIRYAGVSNFTVEQMKCIEKIAPITGLQCLHSLIHRNELQRTASFSAQRQLGVIVFSTLASGLLSGAMTRERVAALPDDDSRRHYGHFREPELHRNLALAELLSRLGKSHCCNAAQLAIAWALSSPGVTGAIIGMRSARQVEGIIGAASLRLDDYELVQIETFLADYQSVKPHASLPSVFRQLLSRLASGVPSHHSH